MAQAPCFPDFRFVVLMLGFQQGTAAPALYPKKTLL